LSAVPLLCLVVADVPNGDRVPGFDVLSLQVNSYRTQPTYGETVSAFSHTPTSPQLAAISFVP
jgi:hypothetical protein